MVNTLIPQEIGRLELFVGTPGVVTTTYTNARLRTTSNNMVIAYTRGQEVLL